METGGTGHDHGVPQSPVRRAKAAEIYVASALARELGPDRIRVNAVSPGSVMIPGGGWDL